MQPTCQRPTWPGCTCVYVLFLQPTCLEGLGLLGQVVHGADEVEDLHHVHARDAEPASTARHVVRLVHPVAVERAREDLSKCEYREKFLL